MTWDFLGKMWETDTKAWVEWKWSEAASQISFICDSFSCFLECLLDSVLNLLWAYYWSSHEFWYSLLHALTHVHQLHSPGDSKFTFLPETITVGRDHIPKQVSTLLSSLNNILTFSESKISKIPFKMIISKYITFFTIILNLKISKCLLLT